MRNVISINNTVSIVSRLAERDLIHLSVDPCLKRRQMEIVVLTGGLGILEIVSTFVQLRTDKLTNSKNIVFSPESLASALQYGKELKSRLEVSLRIRK